MKRGSSVLQPACEAVRSDGQASGSSPFPAATSLFSPDVAVKTASDLLIRLSEATQKAQMHPGSRDEPGPAPSPDGPGASPEPPHVNANAADTLASELLRKLAERQEESGLPVRLKEEEEPMEVDAVVQSQPVAENETDRGLHGANMADQRQFHFGVKMEDDSVTAEERFLFGTTVDQQPFPGAKMEDELPSGARMENPPFSGAKMEEQQLFFGAKMEDQCLRAVLWQDMSVNLASTLLHQLSERVGKTSSQQQDRLAPPTRSSPVMKVTQVLPSPDPPRDAPSSNQSSPSSAFFFRCHVCGFETEGPVLFQSHMTEHRQWERSSFSLHCCTCERSTNQEAEMRAHVEMHRQVDGRDTSLPSATANLVATATHPEKSTSEHRCRICQRPFPGQQELLVHFQGHRQGNQYRCDRCGHLTRTANKLVEHVRVHTGERPFTCDQCPYSAKRRDSLRLHRRVKHGADGQRWSKVALQRLHTQRPPGAASGPSPLPPPPPHHPSFPQRAGWRELSPLLPITTLLSLKPRCCSSSSSSSSLSSFSSSFSSSSSSSSFSLPAKHSFLGYLGLKTSL